MSRHIGSANFSGAFSFDVQSVCTSDKSGYVRTDGGCADFLCVQKRRIMEGRRERTTYPLSPFKLLKTRNYPHVKLF